MRDYPALRAMLRWPADAPLDAPKPAAGQRHARPAAFVRKGPAPPARAAAPAAKAPPLAEAARAALFFQPSASESTFDIALDESLIGNVRARIGLGPNGITATFVVERASERWHIDAEVPRLRRMLEARGLTVAEVRVVQAGDPSAPDLLT